MSDAGPVPEPAARLARHHRMADFHEAALAVTGNRISVLFG